jgi:HEPN domain-containing protein
MLQNKDTSIICEIKDFFASSEKAIFTIFEKMSSLTLSEKQFQIESKCNNRYKNIEKLILIVLYPFFAIENISQYTASSLYPFMQCGKDVFYRFLNNSAICWRTIPYKISKQLIRQVNKHAEETNLNRCLIIDDTDFHKTGRQIEHIGKVFSHITKQSVLAFKTLFMGYYDGKTFYAIDFSLHGEVGKNEKRPYGMSLKETKKRFTKKRDKQSAGYEREQEFFTTKIQSMISMIRRAIQQGIRFDYVLVDSWFTCHELVKFITTRKISCHLLGMAKMGKTRYAFNNKNLTAKELIEALKKSKRVKRSHLLSCHYSQALVDFKGIPVKVFFCKTTRKGNWNMLLTTNVELDFTQAYQIYAIRWSIEVFFKEAKQYLQLGKSQSQDFDAQIAATTISMIQYNLLAVAKRYAAYESLGELFRRANADTVQLTINEKIWQIILEIATVLADLLEIEHDVFIEKLLSDNEKIRKILNYESLKIAS